MDFRYGDTIRSVRLERDADGYRAIIDDKTYRVEVGRVESGEWLIVIDGQPVQGYVARDGDRQYIALNGATFSLTIPDRERRSKPRSDSTLAAPMPGQVTKILVAEGDSVLRGQILVLLEAMKMEIRINAPADARIAAILCAVGQIVERGQILVTLG